MKQQLLNKEKKTILQEVMTKPGEIIFKDVEIPSINEKQVLVKIMNIGICGSDIHVYHGKHPFTKYPVTQGHEVSGLIVKIGKNVKNYSKAYQYIDENREKTMKVIINVQEK